MVGRAIRHINSVVELRALAGKYDGEVVYLRGRTIAAIGQGAGNFVWIAANTAVDDDGYVVGGGASGRWVRQFSGEEVDAGWYGASVSYSQSVNTAAIQAAVSTAISLGISNVRLPGKGIYLAAAIAGASVITFVGYGAFFSDYLYSVEQSIKPVQVKLPDSFSWLGNWKFFSNGAPGSASTTFTVEKAWSANEAQGVVHYFVDYASGSDSNAGTGPNLPLKTLGAAIAKPDVGVVNIKPGVAYDTMGTQIGNSIQRDIVFQSWTGAQDVIIRNGPDPATLTWTRSSHGVATYQVATSAGVFRLMDATLIGAGGDFTDLRQRASTTEVDGTPGSFFYDTTAGILYVRRYTNIAPGTDLLAFRAATPLYFQGRAILLKNIRFEGGGGLQALERTGSRARLYMSNVSIKYQANNGLAILGATAYMERCVIGRSGLDNLNYHDQNGISSRAVEIDTYSYRAGDLAQRGWVTTVGATQNASSMHDTGSVIRVNGRYTTSFGPVLPDTGTSSSMNVGVIAENSLGTDAQNASIYSDGGMYLIDSILRGSTYDIRSASGGTVNVRNIQMAGTILREGGGKVQQY